ncbi:MAG TPA: hypothetical protein VHL11_12270, partial [Phototrophicaceae bacterium]|nr:hypothetical protein [Phototrophicaceae bacterium]
LDFSDYVPIFEMKVPSYNPSAAIIFNIEKYIIIRGFEKTAEFERSLTKIHNINTGETDLVIPGYTALPDGLHPDREHLAVAFSDRLEIWNIHQRKLSGVIPQANELFYPAWNQTGSMLAGTLIDERIKVIDAETGSTKCILGKIGDECSWLTFSPDDHYLACFCPDDSVVKI